MDVAYEDLFDIEKRPGAGVGLWTRAVEMQLERVREANYRHRLHHSPYEQERQEDAAAEWRLHADVYFLALAIRRVLLFHDVFTKHVGDARLRQVRARFDVSAPGAKELRDFYEHLVAASLQGGERRRRRRAWSAGDSAEPLGRPAHP
jgi:hypothetical protein